MEGTNDKRLADMVGAPTLDRARAIADRIVRERGGRGDLPEAADMPRITDERNDARFADGMRDVEATFTEERACKCPTCRPSLHRECGPDCCVTGDECPTCDHEPNRSHYAELVERGTLD